MKKKLLLSLDFGLYKKVKTFAKEEERSVIWAIGFMVKQFFKSKEENAQRSTLQQGSKGENSIRS